jgi:hypothetical protein
VLAGTVAAGREQRVTGIWRREPLPTEECTCGHYRSLHNIETKRQPCSTCACPGFVLHARLWTERRVVREVVA